MSVPRKKVLPDKSQQFNDLASEEKKTPRDKSPGKLEMAGNNRVRPTVDG